MDSLEVEKYREAYAPSPFLSYRTANILGFKKTTHNRPKTCLKLGQRRLDLTAFATAGEKKTVNLLGHFLVPTLDCTIGCRCGKAVDSCLQPRVARSVHSVANTIGDNELEGIFFEGSTKTQTRSL
ncbi:MAG TPA: hypothetical protein VGI40_22205 [Pirellulaceae bacterium]